MRNVFYLFSDSSHCMLMDRAEWSIDMQKECFLHFCKFFIYPVVPTWPCNKGILCLIVHLLCTKMPDVFCFIFHMNYIILLLYFRNQTNLNYDFKKSTLFTFPIHDSETEILNLEEGYHSSALCLMVASYWQTSHIWKYAQTTPRLPFQVQEMYNSQFWQHIHSNMNCWKVIQYKSGMQRDGKWVTLTHFFFICGHTTEHNSHV